MIGYYRNKEVLQALTKSDHQGFPVPLLNQRTIQSLKYATFGPGWSGVVRVHPDHFSLSNFNIYTRGPGGPGENQYTHACARARVIHFLSSDLIFYILLKVPGPPGPRFNIINLHPDHRPDHPGPPGPPSKTVNGGF